MQGNSFQIVSVLGPEDLWIKLAFGVCPLALKCILRYLLLKISFMLLNCFLHLLYHSKQHCEFLWQITLDTLLKFPNTHTQMQHTHSMPNAIWAGGRRL